MVTVARRFSTDDGLFVYRKKGGGTFATFATGRKRHFRKAFVKTEGQSSHDSNGEGPRDRLQKSLESVRSPAHEKRNDPVAECAAQEKESPLRARIDKKTEEEEERDFSTRRVECELIYCARVDFLIAPTEEKEERRERSCNAVALLA